MALFNKAPPQNGNGDPLPTPRNSRFSTIIEKLNIIIKESEEVSDLLSKTIFELQKPIEYYMKLRDSCLVGLENSGIDPAAQVERDIKASIDAKYIPQQYRAPETDAQS